MEKKCFDNLIVFFIFQTILNSFQVFFSPTIFCSNKLFFWQIGGPPPPVHGHFFVLFFSSHVSDHFEQFSSFFPPLYFFQKITPSPPAPGKFHEKNLFFWWMGGPPPPAHGKFHENNLFFFETFPNCPTWSDYLKQKRQMQGQHVCQLLVGIPKLEDHPEGRWDCPELVQVDMLLSDSPSQCPHRIL